MARGKVTDAEAAEMQQLRDSGMSLGDIAEEVGRSASTVEKYTEAPSNRRDHYMVRIGEAVVLRTGGQREQAFDAGKSYVVDEETFMRLQRRDVLVGSAVPVTEDGGHPSGVQGDAVPKSQHLQALQEKEEALEGKDAEIEALKAKIAEMEG